MSRFSPGYYPSNLFRGYGEIERGLADAIAGTEELQNTRKLQKSREARDERAADRADRYADTNEGYFQRAERLDAYDRGIMKGPGIVAEGPATSVPPPGAGQGIVPNVSGMPTIQGPGTDTGIMQTPPFMPEIKGSGKPGDLNPQFAAPGSMQLPGGYFVTPTTPAQKQAELAQEREIRALAESMRGADDYRARGGRAEGSAGMMARGQQPQTRDPLLERMMESMMGRSKSSSGGVTPTAMFNHRRKVASDRAVQRALELMDPNLRGMGMRDAIFKAEQELSQDAGFPVSIDPAVLSNFLWGAGRQYRDQRNFDQRTMADDLSALMGEEELPAEDEEQLPPVYSWNRGRP